MAEQRKFYWLKLMDNFFNQPKIKKLRKIAGGDTYTIIYLKLQLMSLMTDAKIIFENIEDNIIDELALKLDEDPDNVRITLQYLISQGLIEEVQEGEFLLPETSALIGSETASAQRVRTYRQRQKALHCNTDVQNRNGEIEIEKEIEIERDIEIEGRATPTPHSPSDTFITLPLLGGNIAHITYEYIQKQKELFPSLDIEQQIRSAVAWIDANPSKKKKDWKRFLNGWLQRSMKFEKEDSKPVYQKAPVKTSSDYNPTINTGEAETVDF